MKNIEFDSWDAVSDETSIMQFNVYSKFKRLSGPSYGYFNMGGSPNQST